MGAGRQTVKHVMAVCVALVAMAAVAACANDRDREPAPATRLGGPSDAPADAVGQVLMSDGNLPAATASVRQILSLVFPAGAPEAEDVRNDARALLAKLLVSQGPLDEAA